MAVHLRSHIAAVDIVFLLEPMDLPGNKSTPGKNPPWTLHCLLVGCCICLCVSVQTGDLGIKLSDQVGQGP